MARARAQLQPRDPTRLFAQILCGVFGLIGALPLALELLLALTPIQRWAAQKTATLVHQQLGVQARYDVHVHLLPPRLTVERLVVPASDGGPAALTVEKIQVRPRVFSLLSGRLDAGDVEIESPRARLVVRDGKIQNLRYQLPKSQQPSKSKATDSPFGSLSVSDGRVLLDIDGVEIDSGQVDVDVFTEKGPAFELMLSASAASVKRTRPRTKSELPGGSEAAEDHDALCRLELRARLEGNDVFVRRLSLLGGADLDPTAGPAPACGTDESNVERVLVRASQLRVSLREGSRPYVAGHVTLRAPLGLTNRFVDAPPLFGWVGFSGDLRFDDKAKLPELRGRVTGNGLALANRRITKNIVIDAQVSQDVVKVPRIEMAFADGQAVITGARIEPFAKGLPLSVERIDCKHLLFESLMRDLGVTPNTIVSWHLTSTIVTNLHGTLAPLKVDGDLAAENRDFEITNIAYHKPQRERMMGVKSAVLRGKIGLRPTALVFYDVRVEAGRKSSLLVKSVSIGFDNDISLAVAPSRVFLGDINPLVGIPIAGEADVDATMVMDGDEGNPLLLGNLKISGFEFGGFALGDIKSSKVKFRPLWVEFSEVQARKGGSDFGASLARLDFDTRATVQIEARASSERMNLRDFLAMWRFDQDPRWDQIHGFTAIDASLRYVLGGPEDHCGGGVLRAAGKLRGKDLDLYGEHYDGGEGVFDLLWHDRDATYRGIVLNVPEATLRKGPGVMHGKFTMHTGAKLEGEFSAENVPIGKIDAFPQMLRAAEGTANATGKVSGTVDATAAEIHATLSRVRVGRATLPPSEIETRLVPIERPGATLGVTKCGQPISAAFDRADYDRDLPQGVFHLSGDFFGGQVALGDVTVTRQRKKTMRGEITAKALDLAPFLELKPELTINAALPEGRASGVLRLEDLPMDDPASTRGSLALKSLTLAREGFKAELLPDSLPVTFDKQKVAVSRAALSVTTPRGQKAILDVSANLAHVGTSPNVDAKLNMRPTPLAGLVTFLPRVERAAGSLSGQLTLRGPLKAPHTSGNVELSHGELAIRGVPSSLSDIQLALGFDDDELTITRGAARFGNGSLALSGGAPLRGFELGEARIRAIAHDIALPLKDGIQGSTDADLWITIKPKNDSGERSLPRVTGNVLLRSFDYQRAVTLAADLNSLAQRGKRTEFEAYDLGEDNVEFDVTVRAQRPLTIRNEIVEADLTIAPEGLELAGTDARFGLRGALRLKPGGHVTLRRSDFEIQEGSVRFDDLTRIAPRVDVTAVTEYRRYSDSLASNSNQNNAAPTPVTAASSTNMTGGRWTIRMHAHGDADNLHVDLTSDPALPQDDIFLLLTVGLTRAELDQAQSASVGESVALEALGTLTGADRAVKKAVPLIDEFRFGSAYSSRTGRTEPTFTVGKRLTDRLRANVTSGLSEAREVRSNVEWRLSPRVSVEGSYDNVNDISSSSFGNLGADIRWRLEFE